MTHAKKKRTRTYARNRLVSRTGREKLFETDGEYLLKLVVSILLGTFWLKFQDPLTIGGLTIAAIPLGLFVGLLIVNRFEKFQSDRKIWYAVIILTAVISFFLPAGIVI